MQLIEKYFIPIGLILEPLYWLVRDALFKGRSFGKLIRFGVWSISTEIDARLGDPFSEIFSWPFLSAKGLPFKNFWNYNRNMIELQHYGRVAKAHF